ncbi:uncharacterized protein PFL1_05931 [Pseudozyma flocculosa PF-1]|uniref:Formyl transferase C-terminal domain-containing protein n=1 Tax=Pseudozyma flocculosa PF-1 TaxID=1277687 RepID=A0A061H3X1_9BASI|nr:uncharacterized protein PFL1_05931 [Pseudozyma flocculosa PF-1]EPQ26610.1 hypothetical protein PFL1_05931 [Pseudozyma flocculosa PF-1]
MKILFLCTAFNSLSQRLALVLKSRGHAVTVELALSPQLMISAAELAAPDIVVCPFLTKRVPPEVYSRWLTLIVHPGPPGDAGPSAIDWCLFGDMGEADTAEAQLAAIDARHSASAPPQTTTAAMRSHWGVTVLQAIEALDAGPIWAFDQFPLDEQARSMTKSDLYRGPVTRAALNGVLAAIDRIQAAAQGTRSYPPSLPAPVNAGIECVSSGMPFLGGKTHERPLLKASMRDFLFQGRANGSGPLCADAIVQRINSADSQPGVLTSLLGKPLFVYGAVVQRDPLPEAMAALAREAPSGTVLATREGAVLVTVGADLPIWICHLRRPKAKTDRQLHPKLPAVMCLLSMPELARDLGLLDRVDEWSPTAGFGADPSAPWRRRPGTYQQVYVELEWYGEGATVGYVYSEFYNGAFSTLQCELLLEAIHWTLAQPGLKAIVMMGGSGYFSNGIALNVIEGSSDPAAEGWANINAIDDCVEALLAPHGVLTFAAMRGNAAAGGLAVATAADVVLSVEHAVHNPHYRGLGLYGSEWHTYSWYQRCGAAVASKLARGMLPLSAAEAKAVGLVDHVLGQGHLGAQAVIDEVKHVVQRIVTAKVRDVAHDRTGLLSSAAPWTRALLPVVGQEVDDRSLADQRVTNKAKYLAYLFAGRREGATLRQHFQVFRQHELDQMTYDFFHPHRGQRFRTRCTAFVRKLVPEATPSRFALHRRYGTADWNAANGGGGGGSGAVVVERDEEELDAFDSLGDVPATEAVTRLPRSRPELLPVRSVKASEIDGSSPMFRSPSDFSDGDADASDASEWTVPSSAPSAASSPRPGTKRSAGAFGAHVRRQSKPAISFAPTTAFDESEPSSSSVDASIVSSTNATVTAGPSSTTAARRDAAAARGHHARRESSGRSGKGGFYNRFVKMFASMSRKSDGGDESLGSSSASSSFGTMAAVPGPQAQSYDAAPRRTVVMHEASTDSLPVVSSAGTYSATIPARRATRGSGKRRPLSYSAASSSPMPFESGSTTTATVVVGAGSDAGVGLSDRAKRGASKRSSIHVSSPSSSPFLGTKPPTGVVESGGGDCLFSCYYAEDGTASSQHPTVVGQR